MENIINDFIDQINNKYPNAIASCGITKEDFSLYHEMKFDDAILRLSTIENQLKYLENV